MESPKFISCNVFENDSLYVRGSVILFILYLFQAGNFVSPKLFVVVSSLASRAQNPYLMEKNISQPLF